MFLEYIVQQFKYQQQKMQNRINVQDQEKGISQIEFVQTNEIFNMKVKPSNNQQKQQSKNSDNMILPTNPQQNSKLAIAYTQFRKQAYSKTNSNQQNQPYSLFQNNQLFQQNSLSLYFYFDFLKYIIIVLVILSLFQSFRIILHYNYSNGLEKANLYTQTIILTLQKTTVGNMLNPSIGYFLLSSICQGGVIIIWVLLIQRYKKISRRIIQKNEKLIISAQEYSLSINLNEQELKQQKLIDNEQIHEIVQIYNYRKILKQYKQLKNIQNIQNQDCRQITVNSQIQRLKQKSNFAFTILHFKFKKYKNQFISKYQNNLKLFSQKNIIINTNLPKPQNFNWENLQHSKSTIFITILFFFIFLILITLSSFLINIINIYFIQKSPNCTLYQSPILQSSAIAGISDLNLVYCYCLENFPTFNNLCIQTTSYTREVLFFTIFSTVGSLICSITNMAILQVLKKTIACLKLINQQTNRKIFFIIGTIAVLVNTILVPTLITLKGNNFQPNQIFTKILNIQSLKSSYSDFSQNWYVYFSPFYLNVLLVGIGNPAVFTLGLFLKRKYFQYTINKNQQQISQKVANQKINFFQFDIELNLIINLSHLFIVIIFSPAQPIFMLLGSVLFLIHYICHKFWIISFSSKLKYFDGTINNYFIKVIPIALFIQSFFNICVYTSPSIFTDKSLYSSINMNTANNNWSDNILRLFQVSYLFFIWILIGIYNFYTIFQLDLIKILSKSSEKNYQENQQFNFQQRLEKNEYLIDKTCLYYSYQLNMNLKYKQILQQIDNKRNLPRQIIKVQAFT